MDALTGFFEMALVFGGLLAFLFWQLLSLKRSERGMKNKDDNPK